MGQKVIFVGDEPSRKNLDPNVAFLGTKSYDTLCSWLHKLKVNHDDYVMINRTHEEFPTLMGLAAITDIKVVALGNNAERAIKQLDYKNLDFFKMPHPSGRNRKLNNKKYVAEVLKECYNYIHGGISL